jgi:LmbE family N-acetylglucosaminyl deacetylase
MVAAVDPGEHGASDARGAVRAQALLRKVAAPRSSLRVMVLMAHPGDESLGAAGLLSRLADPWVVCLTDGAPRDRRFVPAGFPSATSGYAKRRRQELRAALAVAGIGVDRLLQLDIADQAVALSLPRLVHRLATLTRGLRPHLLVTHGYEGGHPDHDAAALAARLSVERLERLDGAAPALVEMLSYHREEDRLVGDRFLPAATDRWAVVLRLDPRERQLRRQMLACHQSQMATVEQLPDRAWEALRPAPVYDFLRPPHEGPLQYEVLAFSLTGARWRELAREAIAAELHGDETSRSA